MCQSLSDRFGHPMDIDTDIERAVVIFFRHGEHLQMPLWRLNRNSQNLRKYNEMIIILFSHTDAGKYSDII